MDAKQFIGGNFLGAVGGRTIEVMNPARPFEVVGTIPAAGARDVELAVTAARAAFAAWSARSVAERVAILGLASQALTSVVPEVAVLLTLEMGKIHAESLSDVGGAQFMLSFLSKEALALSTPLHLSDDFGTIEVDRRPLGVVAVIVPWNWPLTLLFGRVAAALAMGNTVVCLPSPYASLAVLRCIAALAEIFPAGVINCLSGWGSEAGAALTRHPRIAKISFTGGAETGKDVLRGAAHGVTRTSMELGGNDAAILLDDVEVSDALAASLVDASLTTSGQICFAAKRIYVPDSIYDEVIATFLAATDRIVVGDGMDPSVTMGPMVSAQQAERFDDIVAAAREAGARVVESGVLANVTDPAGYFRRPLIVSEADSRNPLVVKEQFGPAVPFIRYRDVDDAVAQANASDFGLGASVWSSDVERARTVARRLEAGMVFLNRHNTSALHPRGPFGGTKRSGYGRELGKWGLESYSELVQIVDPVVS